MESSKDQKQSEKESQQRKRTFNGLTAKKWTKLSKNVWNDVSSSRKKRHIVHGATFPEKLANRLIEIFSKEGDLIFDPFLGVGTTLEACRNTLRNGIGIELNPNFANLAEESLSDMLNNNGSNQIVINDDCRTLEDHVKKNSIQLIVTSPPYANFIRKSVKDRKTVHKKSLIKDQNKSVIKPYSEDLRDLGNLEYKQFLNELQGILQSCYNVTKEGGYNAWIVKDYRDTKNKIPYIPFHMDLATIGVEVGFKFHDLIIWDQNDQRSLVLLGYPSVFYSNQNCSFIVILRKPPKG